MIGVILASASALMDEVSASTGKWEMQHKREGVYTYGFLNCFWILVVLVVIALVKGSFVFSLASLPLFALAAVLEMAQVYSSIHAIVEAERSTLGFLMILTIPLLLVADFLLGYQLTTSALFGIGLIVVALIFLLINHGLDKKGIGYVLFSAVNAVATISIYKYLITHYNSVEGQQIPMFVIILVFLYIMARRRTKQNPFKYLLKREFLAQSVSRGLSGAFISFAYLYAPASVITSAKRGLAVLLSIISGRAYFHEKHVLIKIMASAFVLAGLVMLV
ncbi:MAG: hypothetical protein AAB391_02000 [Patescibacteria group bacterium]